MKALFLGLVLWLSALPAAAAVMSAIPPVVVVYPMTVNGNADPEAGGRLALLIATRLTDAGGITVKPATPGIDRSHFLDSAKAQGADYYITGYLTPLGDSVSMVSQVVSTYSGIVVWSSTLDIRSYSEATGQADLMRGAILRHAGRTLAALDQPAPAPSSTPAPSSSQKPNEANLTHLFTRKKATPAPAPAAAPSPGATAASVANAPSAARPLPTPRAAATHPPPPGPPPLPGADGGAIVVALTGTAPTGDRAYAGGALSTALSKAGLGGLYVATRSTTELPAHARELCTAHKAGGIFGGTLTTKRISNLFTPSVAADFELLRYDCNGALVARERAQAQATGRSATESAVDQAIAKALDAALHPKAKH